MLQGRRSVSMRELELEQSTTDDSEMQTVKRRDGPDLTEQVKLQKSRNKSCFVDCGITLDKTATSMGGETQSVPPPVQGQANYAMNAQLLLQLNMKLWSVAIPAVTSQLVIIMVETISMLFVGRLNDTDAIAGVGLAIIFVNGTTTSVLMGLNGAVSVLCAIAYGKGDYKDCMRVL
eukprot:CAMPEP_0185573184 /NCGR_PEP_ID=MMETSP0434-20130131/4961_1 /TAXON_ID=626734 ORGANISM="Favella taraikaensis, Strain Fe Narragansett Bay" /NCGR_SAMPLE_ID=MMETSP0434 /ASSEMBLY_ACC=CAM_ASM_000379 /LENGTH=175 /DNA_ID=CAMNT_0028189337 /DNA_START=80 /DNA_END=607 /DNA_ORIENTATION=+